MKECTECEISKDETEFGKLSQKSDKLRPMCKSCTKLADQAYRRSVEGLVTTLHSDHKKRSKLRGHKQPSYTKKELHEWLLSQPTFECMFNVWVENDYLRDLKPSVDRIDDFKGYTFQNIQLLTTRDNVKKKRPTRCKPKR